MQLNICRKINFLVYIQKKEEKNRRNIQKLILKQQKEKNEISSKKLLTNGKRTAILYKSLARAAQEP